MKKLIALLLLLAVAGSSVGQERGKGYRPLAKEAREAMYKAAYERHGYRQAFLTKAATPPAKFDCVEMGWVPVVRDQGNCGSCYEVSTVDQVTCAFIKAGYGKADDTFKISDQFGLDCHNFGGCDGGNGTEVIAWMVKNGFPAERYIDAAGVTHNDYPAYEARPRNTCRTKAGAKMWKPDAWGFATGDQSGRQATVAEIKASIMNYGVNNIAFDADNVYSNAGRSPVRISGRGINHETTLVGWDDARAMMTNDPVGLQLPKAGPVGAWKTRGNWGTGFGDGGYVWMTYDSYLVDVFWVSAVPLPPAPPPPPPTPPVPPPGPVPVDGSPVINSPTAVAATIGTPFSYQITATNSPTVFLAVGLPAGLSANAAGLISGTPTVTGIFASKIVASNGVGVDVKALTITVSTTPIPPAGQTVKSIRITRQDGTTEDYQVVLEGAQIVTPEQMQKLKAIYEEISKTRSSEPCRNSPSAKPLPTEEKKTPAPEKKADPVPEKKVDSVPAKLPPAEEKKLDPPQVSEDKPAEAIIIISCPENASLWIEGKLRTSKGPERSFLTPPFKGSGTYTLEAAWNNNGRLQAETKTITVEAGKTTRVRLLVD